MVSRSEYEKNQQVMQQPLAGAQNPAPAGTPSQSFIPGLSPEARNAIPLAAGGAVLGGGLLGGALGGAGGAAAAQGAGGLAGAAAQGGLTAFEKGLLRFTSGAVIFQALFAGAASIPNSIIGKEINKIASDLGIDVGNLRLNAQEQLYTMPVEDPKTGEWTFLDNDGDRLFTRMQEAGIPRDTAELRMVQLNQLRQANADIIQAVGPISQLRQEGQLQTGELPFSGAQRLLKERREGEAQSAATEQEKAALVESFRRETGLPANEPELRQRAAQGDETARALLNINQQAKPSVRPLSPEEMKKAQEVEARNKKTKQPLQPFPASFDQISSGTPASFDPSRAFTPLPQADLDAALAKIRQGSRGAI